jgi:hypothetical protein
MHAMYISLCFHPKIWVIQNVYMAKHVLYQQINVKVWNFEQEIN